MLGEELGNVFEGTHSLWGTHITVTPDAEGTQDAKVTRHMECSC